MRLTLLQLLRIHDQRQTNLSRAQFHLKLNVAEETESRILHVRRGTHPGRGDANHVDGPVDGGVMDRAVGNGEDFVGVALVEADGASGGAGPGGDGLDGEFGLGSPLG